MFPAFQQPIHSSPFFGRFMFNKRNTCSTQNILNFSSTHHYSIASLASEIASTVSDPSAEIVPLDTPVTKKFPGSAFIDVINADLGNLKYSSKYGPVYKSKLLGSPITMISDLKAIAKCFSDNETFVSSDGAFTINMETLFGPKALFLTDGEQHLREKALVQPAFSPSLLPNYFPLILESSRNLWDEISNSITKTGSARVNDFLKIHFLRIITKVTSDLEPEGENAEEFHRLKNLYLKFEAGIAAFRFGSTWNEALAARSKLISFYEKIIKERLVKNADMINKFRESGDDISLVLKKKLKNGTIDILTVCIAHSLLPTGPNQELDPKEMLRLTELMLLLWFAGYSTQSSTASSCLMELDFDKEIRQRLKDEQDRLIKSSGSTELTFNQVFQEMPILDAYISEVLRLYPAVSTLTRRVTRDILVCGHLIKKGTSVGLDLWWSQRDPKYFEVGDVLNIDRFLGDEAPITVTFGYKGGAHYCTGAALAKINIKTAIAVLLREYDFQMDPTQSRKYIGVPFIQPKSRVKVVECIRKSDK